jgi:hypothetical protein
MEAGGIDFDPSHRARMAGPAGVASPVEWHLDWHHDDAAYVHRLRRPPNGNVERQLRRHYPLMRPTCIACVTRRTATSNANCVRHDPLMRPTYIAAEHSPGTSGICITGRA